MSDPSFNDTVTSVKNAYNQTRAYERDYWNGANIKTRKGILSGRLDFKAVSIETANAYQQDYKAKFDHFIGKKYDSLPSSIQNVITETLIDRGELPNPQIYEGIGLQYTTETGDGMIECDRCDESFIALEDFDEHKASDHGDNDEEYPEAEEAYTASLLPDLDREKLKEARKLLAETDQGELHRSYLYNGDQFPMPTLSEPEDIKGKKGYNANPNAGLYDNKIFKYGTSKDRVALEAKLNERDQYLNEHLDEQIKSVGKECSDKKELVEEFDDDEFGAGYEQDPVEYDQTGMSDISEVKTTPKISRIKSLEGVDFSYDVIEPYAVKSEEAWVEKKKGIEGYDDSELTSEEEDVDELITERKIHGYNTESIKRELMIKYGATEQEALDKVYSIEVNTDDKVAFTFFGKRLSECTEAEIEQLKIYSGETLE